MQIAIRMLSFRCIQDLESRVEVSRVEVMEVSRVEMIMNCQKQAEQRCQ